jgi:hypothetical protein
MQSAECRVQNKKGWLCSTDSRPCLLTAALVRNRPELKFLSPRTRTAIDPGGYDTVREAAIENAFGEIVRRVLEDGLGAIPFVRRKSVGGCPLGWAT